jgi:hypothetical protein
MLKNSYYFIGFALCLSTAIRGASAHDAQALEHIHKACTLFSISPDDAAIPMCFQEKLRSKYTELVQKYEPAHFDGPEEIRRQSLALIHTAYSTLLTHPKVLVYALTNSKLRENRTRLPIRHSFSRQFMQDAVQIVQHERCLWKPTIDQMRCFRWIKLIEAIKSLNPDEVKQLLVANPYLSTQDSSCEKNPHLRTAEVSLDSLEADRLTTYDLVNIDNGETDALSEVYNTLSNSAHEKDIEACIERAKHIHALLISHGAAARFAKKVV